MPNQEPRSSAQESNPIIYVAVVGSCVGSGVKISSEFDQIDFSIGTKSTTRHYKTTNSQSITSTLLNAIFLKQSIMLKGPKRRKIQ